MSKWLDALGTIATQFQIGIGGSGLRRLRFKNGFNGDLEWNPTANRLIALPDASGTIALVESIGARAYHSLDQSLANNTNVTLAFNSERYDSDTIHDNTTNNSRLTCKTEGNYLIGGNVAFAGNATGIRQIGIVLNGSTTIAALRIPAISADSMLAISTIYPLSVNDYVQITAYQSSGGSLNVLASPNYSPDFYMQKL